VVAINDKREGKGSKKRGSLKGEKRKRKSYGTGRILGSSFSLSPRKRGKQHRKKKGGGKRRAACLPEFSSSSA